MLNKNKKEVRIKEFKVCVNITLNLFYFQEAMSDNESFDSIESINESSQNNIGNLNLPSTSKQNERYFLSIINNYIIKA